MLALLDSPDVDVRNYIVIEIWKQTIRTAVPELMRRVGDEETSVRNSIAIVLANFQALESSEALWALTTDESEEVRRLSLRGLSRLGDESVTDLAVRTYASRGTMARQEALDALVELQSDASGAALRDLLSNERGWWWRLDIRRALRRHRRRP